MWTGDLTRCLPFFINEQTVEGPHAEWSQKYYKIMCSKHMNNQVMLYLQVGNSEFLMIHKLGMSIGRNTSII